MILSKSLPEFRIARTRGSGKCASVKTGPMSLFLRALKKAPPVRPIERRLAKQWVKARLRVMYPELRNNPRALEAAYQALDLQPRAGTEPGDPHSYFDITLPK